MEDNAQQIPAFAALNPGYGLFRLQSHLPIWLTRERSTTLPDVPTLHETLLLTKWTGLIKEVGIEPE